MSERRIAARKTHIGLLCLSAFLIAPMLYAGDEDMSPSIYQEFDPVTGYMIPVEAPPNAQQNHAPVTAAVDELPADEPADENFRSQYWIYLFAVMLLASGLAVWVRNKGKLGA